MIMDIVIQHAEEAAFVWLQRDGLVRATSASRIQLARFDNRVDANLDGLHLAGPAGAAIARDAIGPIPGPELFPAFYLALHAGLAEDIEALLDLAAATPGGHRPLAAALAWLEPQRALPIARVLATAPQPLARRVALTGLVAHGARDLPDALLADPDPLPRARALRAAGELGRTDLRRRLAAALEDDSAPCRYAAAWSLTRLGDPQGIGALLLHAGPDTSAAEGAVQLAVRAMPHARAAAWLQALGTDPARRRAAILGAGSLGDPAFVPWLLQQMREPPQARRAAEAFTLITGATLAEEGLEAEHPPEFASGPNDDPEDPDVAMDPDEDLPWPDPGRVADWWAQHGGRFPPGRRLFLGQAPAPSHLTQVLLTGLQGQRAAAALELAIQQPDQPLLEVRAPARRQARLLEARRFEEPH
jgi:uncharacterized protein (TIGR02270 family)